MLSSSASVDASLQTKGGFCVLTHRALNVDQIIRSVSDDAAGATAVFIGTTRNSFKGKAVTHLEYQAYSKLAIKTMANIIHSAHGLTTHSDHCPASQMIPSLIRCVVYHRLGTVQVGEPSIVIAVSSPHRKEAFITCELILEQVKLKVQIWKREYYQGVNEEEAEWKANN